jgi:hypothetical protein
MNAYMLLVEKPDENRPLGRPRRRWVDNIKMNLGDIGSGGREWIGQAQNRGKRRALMKAVINLCVS